MKKIILLILLSSACLFGQAKIKYGNFSPQLKADLKDTTSSIVADTATVIRDEQYQQKHLMKYLYNWRSDIAYDQNFAPDTIGLCILGDSHAAGLNTYLTFTGQQQLGNAGAGFAPMIAPHIGSLEPSAGPLAKICVFTETAGWDLITNSLDAGLWGVNGYTYVSNTNTDTMAWTTQRNPFDLYRIYYTQRSANAGEFVYKIDGVAIDTIDTQSTGPDSLKHIEASTAVGNHKLTISLETTGTDSVIICGVEFLNTGNGGIRMIALTHGGSYTEQWLNHSDYLKQFFTVTKPSLIIISLGANDVSFSKSATEYYNDMKALVDSIQTVSDASILLLSAQSQGDKDTYELDEAQNDSLELQHAKLIDLSQLENIGFFDKYYFLPDWVTASDLGLTNYPTDGVHSSPKGRMYINAELRKILFAGFGGAEETGTPSESRKNIIFDGVKSISEYYLFDGSYSAGVGWNIFGNMTGDYNVGLGYLSGLNETGNHNVSLGFAAGRNNTGGNCNFNGRESGHNNTGTSINAFGSQAGYNNTGNYSNFFGTNSGQNNTGAYSDLFGRETGYYNTGISSKLMGFRSGQYNTGTYAIGIGYYTNRYNTGNYNIAIGGLNTGQYNEGTNILIGRSVHDNFIDDTSNQVAIDNTDIVGQRIFISGHGLGSVNAYRLLRFKEGTGSVGGMTNNTVYKFKIVHADSLESFGFNIGTPVAGSDTLTPQIKYSNSIVIAHNVDLTASNQTIIGNVATTQTIIYGDVQPETLWSAAIDSITVDSDTLKIRVGGQWYGMYEVDAP
jgi:lysophospholipase L1-like esterase